MTKTIPALGAPRLSQETDESTSIERQAGGIDGWANYRSQATGDNYRVIYPDIVDTDISGAMSPFARPGLGPYLRKPLLDTWDILVVYRLDRLTRSIADFEALWKLLEANGKTLVSVSEQIDFGTAAGKLMARQLVIFAEYEREMIRARVKSAYDAARAQGKYPGMQFPFGYMPSKLPGKGWELVPHPEYAPIVAQIADRVITGESLSSICQWLNDTGIPTPRNAVREYGNQRRIQEGKKPKPVPAAKWDTTSLVTILKSPRIIGEGTVNGAIGEGTVNGATMRDDASMAVKRSEPIIDSNPDIARQKWERVKAVLEDNAARIGPKAHVTPLLGVAICAKCGGRMNSHSSNPRKYDQAYRYYYCVNAAKKRGCDNRRQIRAEELEGYAELSLLMRIGSVNITETVETEGIDYSTQMAEVAEAIGDLSTKISLGRALHQDTTKLETQRGIHEANLAKLADAQESARPSETREIELDETWSQRWPRLDWNGRNELLRRKGMTLHTYRDDQGNVRGSWRGGTLESKLTFGEAEPAS